MSVQLIPDGKYKLQLGRSEEAVTALQGMPHLVLMADAGDGGNAWDVAFDGTDGYTLRNVKTGTYLGSKADPTSMAPTLEGVATPFAWKIEQGQEPQTFTLSPRASNGAMFLGLSIIRIYPPPVAWMPPSGDSSQSWRLVKV